MRISWINIGAVASIAVAAALLITRNGEGHAAHYLLNVSYDPTRELYQSINPRFVENYEKQTGSSVAITQSHAGSSYQARRVSSGELKADVVTLGLPSDVEALHNKGMIADGWEKRLPHDSRPYNSTIVFVVRKGNPHAIHDWPDLIKEGVEIIVPDPKTSGNGKLAALAAWGAVVTRGGSESEAKAFLKELYAHTPFLDPAARSTGVAFAIEKKGDVHLAWENEALRETKDSKGALEIVYPPVSIRAEPSVAWVDSNVEKHGSAPLARAYLEFLFTDEGQEIIAREGYRPQNQQILEKHADRLPKINLFSITAIAQDWSDAQRRFFADNGIIDAVYAPKPRSD
ncbi:sulfate ABC transporter, periplasmic sulfate-binding protein [Methylocella silvestris BL2]|uniref:Sulfate ABC transporter, periplasmic sulfate-binding protein n=1 Tax=Methylocella silvestris (strain DSM 15510 / CIP 108128 / LMG 27833 / NCIMB 13906 / BL2) TaxID=395965 RepID=B8ETC3_METSB|nr:sulfate ABC transporter substrate-binding protein [Methylocella silvestris]ACK51765.1 sulfate ABC transporter, periplasmic sulfate-binding protein [Methylocella silvestris BL2]